MVQFEKSMYDIWVGFGIISPKTVEFPIGRGRMTHMSQYQKSNQLINLIKGKTCITLDNFKH